MEEVVLMPRLSDTMEEGVIAEWRKNVGDDVKKGDVLADIETDKATMELESYKNGKLLYIGAKKGEKIPVNGLLCIIGEKGKVDIDAIVAAVKSGNMNAEAGSDSTQPKDQQKETQETKKQVAAATMPAATSSPQQTTDNGRLKASPLAKRVAKEKGIDISKIQGSGDSGRVIKADIDSFKESGVRSPESGVQSGSRIQKPGGP
jgi:pyruvate dehydrogenase E2 component (dihydrolipoamide acetyltransferase)